MKVKQHVIMKDLNKDALLKREECSSHFKADGKTER